jgi:hypothetical protein
MLSCFAEGSQVAADFIPLHRSPISFPEARAPINCAGAKISVDLTINSHKIRSEALTSTPRQEQTRSRLARRLFHPIQHARRCIVRHEV